MSATNLVDQNEAIIEFLDDLLTEVSEEEPVLEQPIEAQAVPEQDPVSVQVEHEALPEIEDESGRKLIIPAWGQQPFQAMVFKVRDLSLAIPLQELSGVIDWQTARVEQQASAMLLLGRSQNAGQTVSVIDTARFIFPDSKLAELLEQESMSTITRIVLIDKGKIGLACDEVFEVIGIQPEQVTWRSENTRRQWLAGTMLDEMIVLLDASKTADILAEKLDL